MIGFVSEHNTPVPSDESCKETENSDVRPDLSEQPSRGGSVQ